MKTSINKNYPFCVWLTTIGVTPLLFLIYALRQDGFKHFAEDVSIVPLFAVVGLIFSLPTFAVYFCCFSVFVPRISSVILAKTILAVVAIIGIVITFRIIDGYIVVTMGALYSGCVIVSSALYKLLKRSAPAA